MKSNTKYHFIAILITLLTATFAPSIVKADRVSSPLHWINVGATACKSPDKTEVKFSATSWTTGDDGTNNDVSFKYQVVFDDNSTSGYVQVSDAGGGNFHFGEDNNYSISGTLDLSPNVKRVSLLFETEVNWNSGFSGGQLAYATIEAEVCANPTGDPETPETERIFAPLMYL